MGDRQQEMVPASHVIIANPPYVRTQVVGAKRSQHLAQRFNLRGRLDLYHAFTVAMANTLQPGGILGLLTSNQFLTTNSGHSLRKLLQDRFELLSVFDLGDTKLFKTAAVLPVIVSARKRKANVSTQGKCLFARIYEQRGVSHLKKHVLQCVSPLAAMKDSGTTGVVQFKAKQYVIERGELSLVGVDHRWILQTRKTKAWLDTVRCNTAYSFHEIAHVRVGVKTTADDVFIQDWESLPKSDPPEDSLLKPLLTHRDAGRWFARHASGLTKLLYPHEIRKNKRCAIRLEKYPRARRFLERHKDRLSRRKYVLESGRHWCEIWVPHKPDEWAQAKIVCPDISEFPRFFFDSDGAVVNGDCYWLTLRAGINESWLFLMLAVANSTFITKYYDTRFHNNLYSGRRRFMAQYVKQFPVPDAASEPAREAIHLVRQLVEGDPIAKSQEDNLDNLVWRAFGLAKDV